MMQHQIDPTVDCVFKAIFGKEENKNLLLHFLNAVLESEEGFHIQEVSLLNPFNEREYTEDKLSVVDLKARDTEGRHYQIEIQLALHPGLKARILYTWSTLYHALINKGDDFATLRPVLSIWLLTEKLFAEIQDYHLAFHVYEPKHKVRLSEHLGIHLLQLPDWETRAASQSELDRWMYFFKEGKELDIEAPPPILQTREMKQAMSVLREFSENQTDYLLYQSRYLAELTYNTRQRFINQVMDRTERVRKEAEQAKKEAELAKAEKELFRQKYEHVLALLEQAGIDPQQV